jgi:hypothetical protein
MLHVTRPLACYTTPLLLVTQEIVIEKHDKVNKKGQRADWVGGVFLNGKNSIPNHDALPSSLLDPSWVQVSQTMELFGTRGTFPALSTKKGKRAC